MDIYNRQENLPLKIHPAIVVGCGGVGFWAATFLAMSGVNKLALIDFDHVEESNLNRIALLPGDVGANKAEVLAEWVRALRPEIEAYPIAARLGDGIDLKDVLGVMGTTASGTVLYDCTDRIAVQELTYKEAQNLGLRRIRAGYNGGDHITVTTRGPAKWGEDEDTGYEITPSWVIPAVLAGAMAVAKEEMGIEQEASSSIGDLFQEV